MHEKRFFIALSLVLCTMFIAFNLSFTFREARRAKHFIRDREIPALGLATAARLDLTAMRYRRAGEELLRDDFILDWIESGERDVEALRGFMEDVRSRFNLLDASIVSDDSETYYGTDGRVLKLSPMNEDRDGWYYVYRETVLDTTIDAWYYPETGIVGMYVNVPLLDHDGRYRGVVGGGIDTIEFSEIISSIEHDRGLSVYMARRDGRLVYATDRQLLSQPVRNLDALWGVELSDLLRREQRNPSGIVFEPEPQDCNSILWGRYLPEWDTFLILEWKDENFDTSLQTAAIQTLPGEWLLSSVFLILTLAILYLAYRGLLRQNRREAALDERREVAIMGLDRLLFQVERCLTETCGGDSASDDDVQIRLGNLGETIQGRHRALDRFLNAAVYRETSQTTSLEKIVGEAVLRASAKASRKGIVLHETTGNTSPEVVGDSAMLSLALDELLEAAVDLAAPGSEILLALDDGGGKASLDLAVRIESGTKTSPGLESARRILKTLDASLDSLPAAEGIRAYRLSLQGPVRKKPAPRGPSALH